jgi:putative hemolysin
MGGAGTMAVNMAEAGPSPTFPASLLETGRIEVRLASSEADVRAAQALRYKVFFEELGACRAKLDHAALDVDDYDALCDHLLAIHHGADGSTSVIGTYRLLRQAVADANRGFYSAGEYDLESLLRHCPDALSGAGQLLELGRSCVAREHRNAATIGLLWRGIASYLERHKIQFMFGCASFPGTDPGAHAAALSYLAHHHLAPEALLVRAWQDQHVPMEWIPRDGYDAAAIARLLPPLLKGYLRVGAMVGDGAFVDHQFNTVDVFVLMPTDRIARRYATRFQAAELKSAA